MKKNLLLIGRILGGFVSGCIVVFGIMLGLTTLLGLTGCSMNVPVSDVSAPTRNNIEWIVTEESRVVIRGVDNLDIEEYKAPIRDGKYIFEEKEYVRSTSLQRGGGSYVTTLEENNYEFVSYIHCVDFDWNTIIVSERDEINFFDYEDDLVMEIVNYYGGPLKHIEEDGWTRIERTVYYRGEQEGYTAEYVFLNRSEEAISKFYDEHKDGGRIVWDN